MGRTRDVIRRGALTRTVWLLATGALLLGLPRASAADVEGRDFAVRVDGKPAGTYQMTITRLDDGTAKLSAQSRVRVTVLGVPVYNYTYRGEEVWKADKLQQFHCAGEEKGIPFNVSAAVQPDGLHLNINGQTFTTNPDVWLTSYWQLPDPGRYNRPIVLMGCDNGRLVATNLESIGLEPLRVAGQDVNCMHFRVTNVVPVDLWYDAQRRLVRQESTSDGHHTLIELVGVRR
jgi:hypothetical protein